MEYLTEDRVLAALCRLPSLPAVAAELLHSFDSPEACAEELAKKIALDPAVSARTLRLANSSFYGLAGRVTSLNDAMMVLGLRQVRAIVLTAALIGRTPCPTATSFDIRAFWRHSIGAALAAQQLAGHQAISPDLAYLGGLVHDIGRLALACSFPEEFDAATVYRIHHDCYVYEAERDVLGLDHADVGRALLQFWHFPKAIQDAVAAHHTPDAAEASSLTGLVHVADVLAHALDLAHEPNGLVPRLSAVAWNRLAISGPALRSDLARIEQASRDISALLGQE